MQLAAVPIPLPWKPDRGAAQTYVRLREQARLQVEGRVSKNMVHECLPVEAGFGLTRLPAPTAGDVFLDLEGDPFAGEGGLEFLFGYAFEDRGNKKYVAHWALTRADEKAAFEAFIDFAIDRLSQYPDLHIFHYAPYEPAALKRLMGRYATREDQLDNLLRAEKFVDLYAVIRHAVRASVESYSIKKLEPLYAFTRQVALIDASKSLAKVQACLEIGDTGNILDADRAAIEGYNRDDCVSTWELRDWLESERAALIAQGEVIDRPAPKSGEADKEISEWQKRVWALIERLTVGIPADKAQRSREQHARWLLAYILDFHRREKKATWWSTFRLRDLSADDLLEERCGLGGLMFVGAVGGKPALPVHRYTFPPQETALRGGEALKSVGGEPFGTIEDMSIAERWVDIKKRRTRPTCTQPPCSSTRSSEPRFWPRRWLASASTSPTTAWLARAHTKPPVIYSWSRGRASAANS